MAWYELCANRFLSDFCHKTYGILCLIFRSDWQWWWWRVQLHPYTFAMRKTPCWSIDGIQNSSTRCQRLYTSGCSTEAREQGKYWQPTAALTATHNIHSLFEKASNVISFPSSCRWPSFHVLVDRCMGGSTISTNQHDSSTSKLGLRFDRVRIAYLSKFLKF